jgi:flagellum-specific ATP synthase
VTAGLLQRQLGVVDDVQTTCWTGTVTEVVGLSMRVASLPLPVGASVMIRRKSGPALPGEVVGVEGDRTVVMPLGETQGIARGDRVSAGQPLQTLRVGPSLLGRVINGLGKPVDGRGPLRDTTPRPLHGPPIEAIGRDPISKPLATGVRAIDTMTPLGRGQRLGVFAQPGVGKSTLLSTVTRHTAADVVVVGLVGERGRELRDFIDNALGEQGLARSVVVCSTSDESPLLRVRAATAAHSVAEHFREQGLDVLLVVDSITRLAHAQRQIGLAAGEPPATKGYPPSVFAMLPRLMERCGNTPEGSITAMYAVLVEGEDPAEPIADACRGILDGHISLSDKLAQVGHYPAIDVLSSISRCSEAVTGTEHQQARKQVLSLVAAHREVEDLINIGAYATGSNPRFDLAIAAKPAIDQLLQQGGSEQKGVADFDTASRQLQALAGRLDEARQQLAKRQSQTAAAPRGPAVAA